MSDCGTAAGSSGINANGVIDIVDDDPAIRDSLVMLFASRNAHVRTWESGEAFLAAVSALEPDCVILDVRMHGLSGPETFAHLKQLGCVAPVIFLTGHADVPIAVAALKGGAYDFLEKPFDGNQLVDLVLAAVSSHRAKTRTSKDATVLRNRLAQLSPRELDVMRLIVRGSLNKQIADQLGIAIRTVEAHRGRIFDKMGVRNAVELAALVSAMPDPLTGQ